MNFKTYIINLDKYPIMWNMFTFFLNKYQNSLPYAFDSNLYTSPLYIFKNTNGKKININENIKDIRVNYTDSEFTLIPKSNDDFLQELTFGCLRLLPFADLINKNFSNIAKILIRSKIYETYLINKKEKNKKIIHSELFKAFINKNFSEETRKIILNYYLQYKSQGVCQNYIYTNDKKFEPLPHVNINKDISTNNIFFFSNSVNYFSTEAYYTSSAVNAVVLEIQRKINLQNHMEDSNICNLIACFENLGMLLEHITHEKDEDDLNRQKYIIIKYSKYLYRIYLILSKIESDDSESYKEMAIKFEEKVIPIRKTYNIKKADSLNIWEITMLGENIEDYVLKIKIKFFEILNNLLSITKIKNKLLEIYTETFKMEF